ncbi:MAG: CheR family methyltransferase [Planctomycetaceae bacterium]
MHDAAIKPIRLGVKAGEAVGTTAFFRNRSLFDTLLFEFANSPKSHFNILFHASSIGPEAYSFIIRYLSLGHDKKYTIACYATDKESGFLQFARNATYTNTILKGMTSTEKEYFEPSGDAVTVKCQVRKFITFLPASDFRDFETTERFEVVFLLNAFIYVNLQEQADTIDKISVYNTDWFLTTGFHNESIKDDMVRNGYEPNTTNIEEIYSSWTDRLKSKPRDKEDLPENTFTDWTIQPFSKIEDYEYKNCAIFQSTKPK